MRSFFPESEEYLPPPQARCVKPYHSDVGDALGRFAQRLALRGKVGMILVIAAIIVVFVMAHSALAAGSISHQMVADAHATATPCATVNCNPWGYNFGKGQKIYHPPTAFCHYFACIANFSKGKGYVEECRDGNFSRSGGRAGSCVDQHGNWRPLLGP